MDGMCLFDLSSKMVYVFTNEVRNDDSCRNSLKHVCYCRRVVPKIVLIQSHICIEQYDWNATGEQK